MSLKEVQLSCNIGEHDFNVKLKAGRKFLANGDKVKISVRFRGRQMAYVDKGKDVVNKFVSLCSDISVVEREPLLGRKILNGYHSIKNSKNKGEIIMKTKMKSRKSIIKKI